MRTSLALALVTGRAVQIDNIRAKRDKPGLMRQHLIAVRAAAIISDAQVDGDSVGSQSVIFRPAKVRPGKYDFAVGTAGSTTLVLQTVLPALLLAPEKSELSLEGGTHNPAAPPYEFLAQAYVPFINRMGPSVSTALETYGFYPAGGGRFTVAIEPAPQLTGFDLLERGPILHRSATALVANLAATIGEREINVLAEKLSWPPNVFHVDPSIRSAGPGNAVIVEIHSEHVREVFSGFGRFGLTSEQVAADLVKCVRDYLAAGVPVGPHLADQLLLPLAIAALQTGRGGSFRTLPLTRHSTTHIELLRTFLEIPIAVQRDAKQCLVTVGR